MKKIFRHAFTMAEILISLTIIGIVAAIMLPSLNANVNEKTLDAKRLAFYSRLSQAFGLIDSISDVGKYNANGQEFENWPDTVSMTFVVNEMSKGLKIETTCDATKLKGCGISEKYIRANGTSVNTPVNFDTFINNSNLTNEIFSKFKAKPAGFMTKNGESVAVYYNPDCMANAASAQNYMDFVCLNILYDLNGSKGPNTLGRDAGIATVLYSVGSELVMPMPSTVTGRAKQPEAMNACSASDFVLASKNELISLAVNNNFLNSTALTGAYWASTHATVSTDGRLRAWDVILDDNKMEAQAADSTGPTNKYICVKKLTN